MRRRQRWAVPAVLAMVAAGVVAVTGPVAAAAPAAVIPAAVTGAVVDLGVSGASSMVTAGGKLFIAVGNQVLVRDLLGKPRSSIGNETGVSQLAVSGDGTLVYAADRGANVISVIDAATGAETARWPTSPCPTYLAAVADRLYYSFGCGNSGAIESVDQLTGGTPVGVNDADFSFSAPPLLSGAPALLANGNGILAAVVPGTSTLLSGSPTGDGTYSLMTNGTGTAGFGVTDLATSPDSNSVVLTGPAAAQVSQVDPNGFSPEYSYPTGTVASAVAFSQTANRFMVGLDGPGPATMQVFDTGLAAGGAASSQITATAAAPVGGKPLVAVPRGVTFGPDTSGRVDQMIYGLATEPGNSHDYLEIGLANPEAVPHLSIGLGSPTAYGKPLLAAVTFVGHPNVPLVLALVPNSGLPYSVPVRTNQWGIAAVAVPVTFSGRVHAYYAGDLLTYHETAAVSPTSTYVAPPRTTATLYGSYSTHGGVMYFHSSASVHLHVLMTPPHAVLIRLVLRVYANGIWLVQPTVTLLANRWGDLEVFLTTASKGYLYQVIVATPATAFNSAAANATTPVFAIG